MEVKLSNVVTTFPIGTAVGLYTDWRTDSGEPTPVGSPIAEAVVDANGDLTFTGIPEGRRIFIAAAQVEGGWRFRGATVPAPETDLATLAEVTAVQALLEAHEALTAGVHGIADVTELVASREWDAEAEEWPTRPAGALLVVWRSPSAAAGGPPAGAGIDLWVHPSP